MVPFAKNAGLLFKEIKKTASNRRVKIGSVENGWVPNQKENCFHYICTLLSFPCG